MSSESMLVASETKGHSIKQPKEVFARKKEETFP